MWTMQERFAVEWGRPSELDVVWFAESTSYVIATVCLAPITKPSPLRQHLCPLPHSSSRKSTLRYVEKGLDKCVRNAIFQTVSDAEFARSLMLGFGCRQG